MKINNIINKYLLTGDKLMPDIHLRHLGFPFSTCRTFTKNKTKIQKLKETGLR